MAKKKHSHQESQTYQQNRTQNPKMEPSNEHSPTSTEDLAEKISNLQSLNKMLLEETVEKRQEVGVLLESKKSLESELTRSASQVEALKAELAQIQAANEVELLRRENEELRRDREMFERKLEDVEREMGQVVRERDEMGKAKFEGDLEIGSMKKLGNELRGEIKQARESFNQLTLENDGLKKDLGVQIEENSKLMEKFLEVEAKSEKDLGELKSKHQLVTKMLDEKEKEVDSMKIELGSVGKNCQELKREIDYLNQTKELILKETADLSREKNEQDVRIGGLEKEICQLNAIVPSLRADEEKWRIKFFELEKTYVVMTQKFEDLGRDLNASMKEIGEKDKEMEILKGEKSMALKSLADMRNELEVIKQENEELIREANRLGLVNSKTEDEMSGIKQELNELQGNLSLLRESNRDELEKNRKLFSEIQNYKAMLDRVKSEKDDAKEALENEKTSGMKLRGKVSEISKKMEETAKVIEEMRATADTLVREKKELEIKHSKLVEEKGFSEKKIGELEALMRLKSEKFELTLAMLKDTAMRLSMETETEKKEGVKKIERKIKGQQMHPYEADLEVIKTSFKKKEERVCEMEKEMETLKLVVKEAKKKKSLYALVSSATTILAAVVSFAYASKAH